MKILARLIVSLAGLGLAWSGTAGMAQGLEGSEYGIKAAYLYNFALFAEWPADPAMADAPVTICIAGKDPFGAAIAEEFKTRRVHDRAVEIRYIRDQQDPRSCHVLFINEPNSRRLQEILQKVKDAPVLTVGDSEKFIDSGGMIGFIIVDNHVQFEVNQGAAENVDLKLSSRMLQLAYRVKEAVEHP